MGIPFPQPRRPAGQRGGFRGGGGLTKESRREREDAVRLAEALDPEPFQADDPAQPEQAPVREPGQRRREGQPPVGAADARRERDEGELRREENEGRPGEEEHARRASGGGGGGGGRAHGRARFPNTAATAAAAAAGGRRIPRRSGGERRTMPTTRPVQEVIAPEPRGQPPRAVEHGQERDEPRLVRRDAVRFDPERDGQRTDDRTEVVDV